MRLCLLGPLTLENDAERVSAGSPKERRVLTVLALSANRAVSESALIDALWGDEPPRSAARTLHAHISRVRRTLSGFEDELSIDTVPSGYVLRAAPGALDVSIAYDLAQRADQAAAAHNRVESKRLREAAVALWRGRALDDLAGEPFAVVEATRLEELRLALIEEIIDDELALGRHQHVIGQLEALTAEHPLRERLWGQRMIALYRSGRQAEALRAFQEVRGILADELGLEPSPDLRALEADVIAHAAHIDFVPLRVSTQAVPDTVGAGVFTFLLTDIVDSTSLWESYPDEMAVVLARHDDLIKTAVDQAGGSVVKSKGEGDSTLSIFHDAVDAVSAAVEIQRLLAAEPWPNGVGVWARAALHTGETHWRDDDYYGATLNRAARLRGLAAGGEIVLSGATADLVRTALPTGVALADLGVRRLRGFRNPERVYALRGAGLTGSPTPPKATIDAPLPSALDIDGVFVGRDEEMERIGTNLKESAVGRRRAVLVGGEPGIGKTTLVTRAARRAYEEGSVVLFGRCDEDLSAPYQPFSEGLRHYVACCDPETLAGQIGNQAAQVARLVPIVGDVLGVTPAIGTGSDEDRYRLFEAVETLLRAIAVERPVVLVIDDLHWASAPTLLMLRHLLRPADAFAFTVLATFRDSELDQVATFRQALPELRLMPGVDRIRLGGLAVAEVCDLIEAEAGVTLDDTGLALAVTLGAQTQGNALFLRELVRHLVESGALDLTRPDAGVAASLDSLGIPEGVREVVTRRLSRLSDGANRALAAASVVGSTFELQLVALMVALDHADTLDALEEAHAARLIAEVGPGQFVFEHAVIRHALYGGLMASRRALLHRRAGEAIEQLADAGTRLGALALHFSEAAGIDPIATAKAVDYAALAGAEAVAASAFETAVDIYDRGLQLLGSLPDPDRRMRAALKLGRARAHFGAGDLNATRVDGLAAAEDAEAASWGAALAMATGAMSWLGASDYEGHHRWCQTALELLSDDEHDVPFVATILSEFAIAEVQVGSMREAERFARAAVETARRARPASDGALAQALYALVIACVWTDRVGDRLAAADECVALQASSAGPLSLALGPETVAFLDPSGVTRRIAGDRPLAVAPIGQPGLRARAPLRLETGDLRGFLADAVTMRAVAEKDRHWFHLCLSHAWSAVEATVAGRFEDADASLNELLPHVGALTGAAIWWEARTLLSREIGQLADALAILKPLAGLLPMDDAVLVMEALDHAERDDRAAAQSLFEAFDPGATNVFDSATLGVAACALAEVSGLLDDQRHVSALREALMPISGRLVAGMSSGATVLGSADRFLGILATLERDWAEAEERFERALAFEASIPAPTMVARTQYWYARMLRRRDAAGDRDLASQRSDAALAIARELGMSLVDLIERDRN